MPCFHFDAGVETPFRSEWCMCTIRDLTEPQPKGAVPMFHPPEQDRGRRRPTRLAWQNKNRRSHAPASKISKIVCLLLPRSHQGPQPSCTLRRPQLSQCFGFDLPDPLARHVELLPDLL